MIDSSRPRARTLAAVTIAVLVVLGPTGARGAQACWWPPVVATVADPYREPACRWCPGNRGIEYDTRPGTRVRAVAAGRVTYAGAVAGRRYVVVLHANGWRTTYGDLAAVRVERGDTVVARTSVGTTGDTFHFGVRDRNGYLDPAPFLGRAHRRPRLVPLDGSPGAPPGPAMLRC